MSRLSIVMSLLFIGCVHEHPWARGEAEAVILDWPAGETTLDIDLIVGIVPGIWPDEVVSNAVRLSTEPPVFIDYWDHPELVVSPNRMGAANLRGILEECVEDSVCATKIPVRLSTDTPPQTIEVDTDIILTGATRNPDWTEETIGIEFVLAE